MVELISCCTYWKMDSIISLFIVKKFEQSSVCLLMHGLTPNAIFPLRQCCFSLIIANTLRKLAHAIYRDFLALKIENFQLKNFDIFLIFGRDGSNEYPQSMFWSKNKKKK